jgi:Rod binding domain-containing protein
MSVAGLTVAAPLTQAAGTDGQIRQKAVAFTAVALTEMLSPMFDTLASDGGPFGGGAGETAFRPMLVEQMADGIARQGGLGLTDIVARAMLRLQESRT